MSLENTRSMHTQTARWWLSAVLLSVLSSLGCSGWCAAQEGKGENTPAEGLAWAKENLKAGRYGEAVGFYRKAVVASPAGSKLQLDAMQGLVRTLRITGGYKEATELCAKVLKTRPKDTAFGCAYAELLAEVGKYTESIKAFNDVLLVEPEHDRAWALRKEVAKNLGNKKIVKETTDYFFKRYEKKVDYFNSDKVKNPLELAYVGLGIKDENPKDAFEVGFLLAEGLVEKRAEKEEEVLLWSARLAYELYAFGKAGVRFETVRKFRPNHPDALAGLAEVYITARHDTKKAEPLLRQALQINPNHVQAHLTQAAVHIIEDKFEAARSHIDAALSVNPNHLDALALLAFYHHDLNQADQEAEIEKRVLAINPKHADYYCSMGNLMEDKRGYKDATAYFKKAVEVDPTYWRGYFCLGMNTSRQGAHGEKEGKRLLLKAFKMNRFNIWAYNMIKVLDKIIGDEEQQVPPVYAESKTAHFALKFYKKEAEIMRPYMEEWAEAAFQHQTKLFGYEPKGPLTIELMSTNDQSARTVGLPGLPALGVCFGKLCTVVTPRENKNRPRKFNWRKVLDHEFCHVMTLQMSDFRVPRWYTEAFSTYVEDDSRIQYDPMMVNYIAKNRLLPIQDMNQYFRSNPLMAYIHGRHVIEHIDKTYGFDSHKKALRMFAEGKKVEKVFPEVTGATMDVLNKGQLKDIKDFFKNVQVPLQYDQTDFARLEGAANSPKATAEDVVKLAVAHFGKRQLELAKAGAKKALEMDSKCVDALNIMGALDFQEKKYEQARKWYLQSTAIDPGRSFPALQRLGVIYNKEGRTTKAIEYLEKARKLYPRYVGKDNPHFLLPDLYEELEEPRQDLALQVWKDAIRVNSDDLKAAKEGLKYAIELKKWKDASLFADRCNEIDPFDRKVHPKAGRVYEALKDYKRAAREYRVATALNEKDVESWVSLARVEKAQGHREAAAAAVKAALDVDGTHPEAKKIKHQLGIQ